MPNIPNAVWFVTDANGDPVPFGKLRIDVDGTATLASVYSDRALTVAAANPVVADASGKVPTPFVANGTYKLTMLDADDVVMQIAEGVQVQEYDLSTVLTDEEGSVQPYHFGVQDQYRILTNPNGYADLPQWGTMQQVAGAFEDVTFPSVQFNGQVDFIHSGANIRMKDTDFGDYWGRLFVDDLGHIQVTAAVDTKAGYQTTAIFLGRDEDPESYAQAVLTLEQADKLFTRQTENVIISNTGIALKMFDTNYSAVDFAAIYPDDVGEIQIRTAIDQGLGNTVSARIQARGSHADLPQTVITREKGDARYLQNHSPSTSIADATADLAIVTARLNALLAVCRNKGILVP